MMSKITQLLKLKSTERTRVFLLLLLALLLPGLGGKAQTTITTGLTASTSTGSGGNGITFGIENTSTTPQMLTEVGYYVGSAQSNTVFELWMSSTSLSGPQPAGYPSAGWTLVATVTTGTFTTSAIQPVFTGLTHIIPGNTTQRFAMVKTSAGPLYSSSGSTVYAGGGVNLLVGAHQIGGQNVGYAATITPRYWAGSITFIPAVPCSGTPSAGTANIDPAVRTCPSEPIVLSLSGTTMGAGMTFQWERSDQGANNFSPIPAATTPTFTVSNQAVASDYRCVVTCTNTNQSDTSNIVTANQPGVYTANFYEDFDTTSGGGSSNNTVPTCWTYLDDMTGTGYGYTQTSATYSVSPSNSFRFYMYNSTTNNNQYLYLISPETDNLGNGTKQVRFSARYLTQGGRLEVVTLGDISSPSAATASATVLQSFDVPSLSYEEFIVPLPVTTDDYFAFRVTYNGNPSNTYPITYIDDVYYEDLLPCMFPTNIQVTNIATTSISVSWTASTAPGVTSYDYEVRDENGIMVRSGSTTGTSVNVTGLSSGTPYSVYVRSRCGTTPGIWTTFPAHFLTLCDVVGDFYENFNRTPAGTSANNTVPICWTYLDDMTSTGYGYTYNSTTYAKSGTNSFRFYMWNSTSNNNQYLYLVSPETNNLGNGNKQIRFSVMMGSATVPGRLQVVSLSDISSPAAATASATVIETFDLSNASHQEFIAYPPVTTDDYFAFRVTYDGVGSTYPSFYIDDVYYEDVPPLLVDVDKIDILCNGANSGEAFATVEGGKPPYSYSWSPSNDTLESVKNLTPGVHTLTVTDDRNTTVTASVTILEPAAIISGLTFTDVTCNGQNNGSASVSPSGGVTPYTAIWSDNTIGFTNNNLAPGAYSVTIRDANGCPLTEHFVIDEPAVLASSIDTLTHVSVYGGSDGSVTLDVTGGTQPYTYDWTPLVSTSDSASGLTAGTYTVVITDANGCSVTQVVDITEPLPPFEIHLVSLDDVSCNGSNDGSIVVNVIGPNPPFTYSWSPSGGNGTTASNLTSGTYTLTVVDATNEQISETFTIDEPAAMTVSVSNIIDVTCNGSSNGSATASVVGGVAPYTYTWSNGESTPTALSLSAGTHYVLITDANGCQMQAPFSINQPSPMVINVANITDVSCNGLSDGAITIAVNGGLTPYTYQWNNNQTTANIDNLAAGSYNVIVTDANGCTQTRTFSLADPAFVHPPSAVNQSFCQDSAPDLTAVVVNGTNIKWYDAATGGNLLASSTQLVNGMTYYASQTVGTCESSVRTPVQVTLHSAAPLTSSSKTVCANTVVQDVTIDGYNYMQLKWYTDATTPVALSPTTLLSSTTYYVSTFTNGVCESNRLPVNVVVMPHVPAPVVSPQQVCGSGNQLNDLNVGTASGATLVWFATAQGTTPLPGTTQALSGTYYVEQMIGTCKSVRVAVPVQVIPVSAPMLTDLATCEGTTIEEFNQQIAPNKYVWYTSNSASTALPETTLITSGTYYIAEDNSGCISNRAIVNVVVNPRPNRPTGPAIQTFSNFATVGDLFANPQGVRWFSTEQDALTHNNQLPSNAPLIDYKKYYGVVVGANNCVSFPLEVTARILTVSNDSFDLTQLSYYPNPTEDVLNISYVEAITQVEVYSISGQKVLSQDFDSKDVKIDLTGVSSGTYMVKIATETASQYVKVVRK